MTSRRPATFPCPNCGAAVRKGARACRACGSDAQTGWAEDAATLGVDLPTGYAAEREFDYEDWLRKETAAIGGVPAWRNRRVWKRLGLVVLVVLLALLLVSLAD